MSPSAMHKGILRMPAATVMPSPAMGQRHDFLRCTLPASCSCALKGSYHGQHGKTLTLCAVLVIWPLGLLTYRLSPALSRMWMATSQPHTTKTPETTRLGTT